MAETRVEWKLRGEGGRRRSSGRLVVIALLALLAVGFIGVGSGRPLWRVGGPSQLISSRSYLGDLTVLSVAATAAFTLLVYASWGVSRRRDDEPELEAARTSRWVGAVIALAMLATVAATMRALSLFPRGKPESTGGATSGFVSGGGAQPRPPAHQVGLPPVHWWGFVLLVLVPVASAVAVWRLQGRRGQPVEEPTAGEGELLAAVDLSLEDIEREPDPRRAVIRAYTRMEGALGRQGLARQSFETPLEYLGRTLSSLRVGRRSVERLTALHERAKFSQHDVDASMKSEALAALTALRDELAGAA